MPYLLVLLNALIKLDAIDSTNVYLRKLILEKNPTAPTVVMSQYQKKGKVNVDKFGQVKLGKT